MTKNEFFRVGDRVRLSELGESRMMRVRTKAGRVVGFGHVASSVRVLLDGQAAPVTLHKTYLVKDSAVTN
jgi:hypothetical protein